MSNRRGPLARTPRLVRIRHRADAPPKPLGCRWCGHPPYAHDAGSLPHRHGHEWEHPTTAQMRARLDARRRLGLAGRFPAAVPARPAAVHPPAAAPRLARHARPAVPAIPRGVGRAPDTPPPVGAREPHRVGAAA
ncbi:hypothetical protein Skr01_33720 [Sphaerisporangium krabiense]|uniref:Uncharacterized protein n=1 Tax=Sphaerisporangium krabiense TaxID=763782 RepID=A0A7W8Z2R9_9ACTN|nr:hypothetical protein [Sphaerisporangium krabiense]MBB5626369.1 hypothetical protein [Sphaerisporangium krabiense]GII63287.1 hypothetical protein Skr01_33720 [Sphaerisporangium krabiense]